MEGALLLLSIRRILPPYDILLAAATNSICGLESLCPPNSLREQSGLSPKDMSLLVSSDNAETDHALNTIGLS